MDSCFAPILGDDVFCYIDDVVICGDDPSAMLAKLRTFLGLCRETGFYLRLDKSEWFKPEVAYLGHRVGKDGIRSFLGVAGYLRNFIPNYSTLVGSLFGLLKKDKRFDWSEECQAAFVKLKEAVARTATLYPPVPGGEYVIYTDASEVGARATLMQVQEGREVPIEYASKKFTDAEQRWDTRERELFAVKWAIDQWRDYVGLTHFTVVTDHNNLRYLAGVDKGKVFRWALRGESHRGLAIAILSHGRRGRCAIRQDGDPSRRREP
ncbi:putative polyprotein [Gregarina niphandrodes]|uniref:Polyprotein n=1 Tax=Gregarina niphandrodes TaxID=110365 RepID=A0A023AXG3_GRENI|nr:putative polyprotein [Gregarina niphandrodes]EZG42955.1 putative polyprotein [Gregarina niphandrodes]|eukprot:XP_011134685.1 putative polyprotein [Gregarina niphandrodes]